MHQVNNSKKRLEWHFLMCFSEVVKINAEPGKLKENK